MKPYAYQIVDEKETIVNCQYVLINNKLTFDLSEKASGVYYLLWSTGNENGVVKILMVK